MNKEEAERRWRLKSLANCIDGENFDVPKDLEKRADSYEKNKKNVAKSVGYHPCDISIYTNPFHYIELVLEALVRMPSTGKSSLIGKDELKRFLEEGVKINDISPHDKKIIEDKYIHYKSNSYRRSDRKINAHPQLIKLFLNDKFWELYEKSFGKRE
ncbi:MAG: hypothetical protein WC584_04025 [Candidatus Pacearchaeota archaeon]